jgi:hypothetical protein
MEGERHEIVVESLDDEVEGTQLQRGPPVG